MQYAVYIKHPNGNYYQRSVWFDNLKRAERCRDGWSGLTEAILVQSEDN